MTVRHKDQNKPNHKCILSSFKRKTKTGIATFLLKESYHQMTIDKVYSVARFLCLTYNKTNESDIYYYEQNYLVFDYVIILESFYEVKIIWRMLLWPELPLFPTTICSDKVRPEEDLKRNRRYQSLFYFVFDPNLFITISWSFCDIKSRGFMTWTGLGFVPFVMGFCFWYSRYHFVSMQV